MFAFKVKYESECGTRQSSMLYCVYDVKSTMFEYPNEHVFFANIVNTMIC